jgi:hypothetical protein
LGRVRVADELGAVLRLDDDAVALTYIHIVECRVKR